MQKNVRLEKKSVFTHTSYKDCINHLLLVTESQDRGQKSALARSMGCQPAYLSRALNGDGDLNLEQVEAATRFFILNAAESHYLMALLGENRAGTQELKKYWKRRLKEAKAENSELKGRLDLDDVLSVEQAFTYYGSWYISAIHVATSLEHVQTLSALAEYFSLTEETVRSALAFLIDAGLVEKSDGRYKMTDRNIHLPRKSSMVDKHHINWKLKSLETMNSKDAIRYTGVVTLSAQAAEKMKELILQSVQEARTIVRESEEEILGCYSFEFFEVGNSRKKL